MSAPFRRGRYWTVKVQSNAGKWVNKTTGSTDKRLAVRIARMLDHLGPQGTRQVDLLDLVIEKRLSVGQLYDAYAADDLDELRARLRNVDLSEHIAAWRATLRGRHLAEDTVAHYELYARSLMPDGRKFLRSDLTFARISQWLAGLRVGPSTARKYHASLSSFCQYLLAAGVLDRNPMRDVKAPQASQPRLRFLRMGMRSSQYLRNSRSPIGLSRPFCTERVWICRSVSRSPRGDLDPARQEVHTRRTKTKRPIQPLKVDDWAWPYVQRHSRSSTKGAPLFPGINRWRASDKHREACEAARYRETTGSETHAYVGRAGAPGRRHRAIHC